MSKKILNNSEIISKQKVQLERISLTKLYNNYYEQKYELLNPKPENIVVIDDQLNKQVNRAYINANKEKVQLTGLFMINGKGFLIQVPMLSMYGNWSMADKTIRSNTRDNILNSTMTLTVEKTGIPLKYQEKITGYNKLINQKLKEFYPDEADNFIHLAHTIEKMTFTNTVIMPFWKQIKMQNVNIFNKRYYFWKTELLIWL